MIKRKSIWLIKIILTTNPRTPCPFDCIRLINIFGYFSFFSTNIPKNDYLTNNISHYLNNWRKKSTVNEMWILLRCNVNVHSMKLNQNFECQDQNRQWPEAITFEILCTEDDCSYLIRWQKIDRSLPLFYFNGWR